MGVFELPALLDAHDIPTGALGETDDASRFPTETMSIGAAVPPLFGDTSVEPASESLAAAADDSVDLPNASC